MSKKIAITCVIAAAMMAPVILHADENRDNDRDSPKTYVKDSAITVKVKSKLAAEHAASLANIHVDTDAHGVVWLSGHARSEEAIEKAVSIARGTEGVTEVKNHIRVKKDD
jgi:hyperosmotically inducible periplasmic protein